MKIFVMGLPKSGRTTIAKSLSDMDNFFYVDALIPAKRLFADKFPKGTLRDDDYHNLLIDTIKVNNFYIDIVSGMAAAYPDEIPVIDGIFSPKDFSYLFDPVNDIVIFLNRLDNETEFKDYEDISLSVSRDYCFWLSSTGVIDKDRWLEYNFKMTGEYSAKIRTLGSKNTVFIVKTIERLTEHLGCRIKELVG